jgi:predicted component of type VI protein secretion system
MDDELFFEIGEGEAALLETYERLREILEQHGDELPPFAQRNAVKALAALWQVANGLGRQPGQVYDVGA